jgi:predicted transcriptional regulator
MAKEVDDIIQSLRQGLENIKKVATDFEKTTEGVSAETRKGDQKKIDALKEQNKLIQESADATEEQKKEANEVLKSIEKQNKILKEQYRVTGRINQEFAVTGNKYKDFLMTTAAQYNYAQDIAKEYRGLVKSLGLGSESSKLMTKSFKEALPTVLEMGLTQEDLGRVYETMAENSGRITPISSEDAAAIASVAAGTGIMASDAASMGESFSLMGVSATEMEESLMETYKSAQSMGLNATKVIKTLQSNMSSMQSYSFAGGVKGMTEMAKQAVKMRLDVSDVLNMADKFYQPEAAIEAAANLQMLGGDIAEAFGDPFETMYLARNKPEELAKKVGEMTENMMQFNEETGEYEFPAEVRMQLKSAGEQLGINTDKMIEMARQAQMPFYWRTGEITYLDKLEDFAKLVAQHEREACAKVCEDSVEEAGDELAWQIRARGQA